ncbi:MAG: DUF5946 family protein [Chloroflexota bacterium]|nr:DUF5946 family protein [Chloroflexota bacterium]
MPATDGPTHRYVGASPGCWAIFGAVQVRGYEDVRYAIHQMGVDTYMAQHPGTPSPQSIQSVAVHLIGLCLYLEHGYTSDQGRAALTQAVRHKAAFVWLVPPPALGTRTVLDVYTARDVSACADMVRQWAYAVWEAWAPHHAVIRAWAALL